MNDYTSIAQEQRGLNLSEEELLRRALNESMASSGQDPSAVFSQHSESIQRIYQEVISLVQTSASQSPAKKRGVFSLLHGWMRDYPS